VRKEQWAVANTGFVPFDTTVDKTNRILRQIEDTFGWPKERRNQSYAALRAVLHALRDRLIVEEAAQLAAQLPMLVRGIYYEGWDPARVPVKMHHAGFLERVRQEFPYEVPGGIAAVVQTTVRVLRQHITEGEWADVKSLMPKDLATALP
jgi:uncharacterized protein (DUF2267 family)